MKAVKERNIKCGTAAKKFNVPRKSLVNRIKGYVAHGLRPGPATMLTTEKENALVEYIKNMCSTGLPISKTICGGPLRRGEDVDSEKCWAESEVVASF